MFMHKSLSLSCATEHKQIAAGEKNATTFVNCHIEAPKCDDNERQPIDLVIVLDKSASMAELKKLDLCKTTLTFLSRELSAMDRVSLVVYDRDVTTVQPLTLMTQDGKALFEKRVRTIQAGTCTNLSGGLFAGLDEIQRHERSDGGSPNPIRSVLLLTDGLANYGVVKSLPLLSILESCYNDALHPTEQANAPPTGRPEPSSPVSLFTFGYGDNHDAKLLRCISDFGRGAYYFVENADAVSLAFADCLGGLLSVVAQNIQLEVLAASPGVRILEVNTKRPQRVQAPGLHYVIELGDLYSEELRDLLVHVETSESTETSRQHLVEFRLRYVNVLTSRIETMSTMSAIDRPSVVTDTSVSLTVTRQMHRLETADAMDTAQREADDGRLDLGQARLAALSKKLQRAFADLRLDATVGQEKMLLDDLRDCQEAMQTLAEYRSRGQYRLTNRAQTHHTQRSNDTETSWVDIKSEDSLCSEDSGTYRNGTKRRVMARALDMKRKDA
ncbi:hypothetical protein SPRG_12692 [Saprolegnia parasitica CBS 223.65]|uniref:VWFA domain-containing protein n=1 Tax=Saprolegnia parasitica (strain CBS 223.65) TaxID=695850 RepID=A0A067C6Q8_SAPPC|nr:hypothetical protein SPRG_12692 [Saprolegnia parasitica CBS 223.65]KDO22196.1 hypothetical protein SPRG_12692 [Saprolegnia parasitica CBS 223.65]|eukprot:XP_012207132.1 hypothetical protein SPRG_12692 [Saprolegnia parasitica CBS 223.65]